ncbi:MAG TPA: pyridoxal phosphate-dependent aminotransferase [Candidatus Omnitrophota bacterium]|nr:pyridoxal phosphate-dependent aminotransferase [Candidatus Omnitrophota bacterium]
MKRDLKSCLANRMRHLTPSLTLAVDAKAKKLKAEGIPVISFGAGEPDFDTPPLIKEAAIQAIHQGVTKYTPAQGTLELRKAIAEKLSRENGISYVPDEVVVSCGAKHSIYNVLQVLIEAGDEVLIPSPFWLSYPEMVTLAGGKSVLVPTEERSEFKVTPESLANYVTKKTKVFILNSPSNPTGTVYSPDEIRKLAVFAKERGLIVISDEIYEKLIYDGVQHLSIASLDEEIKGLTITVNGHSKTYAMTGWRIGYIAGPKEIAQAVSSLQSHSTSNPTSFAQSGALAAFKIGDGDIEKVRLSFEKRRDLLAGELSKIKALGFFKPKGAFYLFCNIEKTGLGSVAFCEKLLETKQVACVPGVAFGSDKHIRLSFAISEKNIIEGIRRIGEFVQSL